jgi:hypothetical protein
MKNVRTVFSYGTCTISVLALARSIASCVIVQDSRRCVKIFYSLGIFLYRNIKTPRISRWVSNKVTELSSMNKVDSHLPALTGPSQLIMSTSKVTKSFPFFFQVALQLQNSNLNVIRNWSECHEVVPNFQMLASLNQRSQYFEMSNVRE